jgi:hypothetical protein
MSPQMVATWLTQVLSHELPSSVQRELSSLIWPS